MDRQHIEELVMAAFWKMLGKKSFIQGAGLIERLAKDTKLDTLAVQGALSGLERDGILSGICNGIPSGKVTALVEKPVETPPASLLLWKDSLAVSTLSEDDQEILLPLHEIFGDMQQSDHKVLIQGLVNLRADQDALQGRPSFMVSSEYLLGSSKILDALPTKALRQFGIDKARFTGAPPVLLVAGPSNPVNVVLVENPHAFWKAIRSEAVRSTVFIVTFGYGLSMHGEDFGNQLVTLFEDLEIPLLSASCAGSPPSITELLRHENISFWGDLDIEGLRIFKRLLKIIPQLRLSALYKPMLAAVCDPVRSHAYVLSAGKHKQVHEKQNEEWNGEEVNQLYSACADRSVDQEAVTSEEIVKYGQKHLSQ